MDALQYHKESKLHPCNFKKTPPPSKSPSKSCFAPKIPLPLTSALNCPYEQLYTKNPAFPINLKSISKLFEYSLAISGAKFNSYLRVNPSNENLHPEESYIVLKNSLYHFNPNGFVLEEIGKGENLTQNGAVIILTSTPLHYPKRSLRYSLLDTGHAIASLRFASNLLGWEMGLIISEDKIKKVISQVTDEVFEAAFYIQNPKINFEAFEGINFKHKPAAKKRDYNLTFQKTPFIPKFSNKKILFRPSPFSADEIVRYRRSASDFKQSYIKKEEFLDILDKTLPRNLPPFDTKAFLGTVNFVIFVNRVDGMKKGIYFFERLNKKLSLIKEGDFSKTAKTINCNQDLAQNSSFTLSMVIDKKEIKSNYHYKMAMFEAGMIGQVLYLEAEAKNLRGCGLGCFFDDLISLDILNNKNILTLYGFSIGEPVMDKGVTPLKADANRV